MFDSVEDFLEHHGIKGMKWGVRRPRDSSTGLVQRTSSADQIKQDRIASKLKSGGTSSLSNKDLEEFTRRINLEQQFNKAVATPEAQKAQGWLTRFVKTQGQRQVERVAKSATDLAVEHLLAQAGVKLGGKNPELGKTVEELSKRIKPKKK